MKTIGPNISNVNTAPAVDTNRAGGVSRDGVKDSLFRDQLSALQGMMPAGNVAQAAPASQLKFSNHAVDRMQARGIRFSPDEMAKIENAVGKAQAKGAKDTLLLTDSSALIVSVKDKTVVTVMDKAQLKDNVFTNIDSTVMI
jgi:flagellar operon protein